MLKRVRHLKISLAKKCLLLFGGAVLMIISAALYFPWQRMEQLMEQMNERTARTLADWAEANHVAQQVAAAAVKAGIPLTTRPSGGADLATTLPAGASALERVNVRLILFEKEDETLLGRFELRAKEVFERRQDADAYFKEQRNEEGPRSFRYAKALVARESCIGCHSTAHTQPVAVRAEPSPGDPAQGANETEDAGTPVAAAARAKLPLLGLVSIEIPYQVDAQEAFLNRIFMFLAGFIAGTLAIFVFYMITTRLILSPVRVLQETAEKVSKGDLNIRSDISTGDEFQQLSETLNRMLANLKQGEDQLRAINKSLDMKIGQLAESNVALYESNRLKSEFLANVSHELRTPLNSILGFAELLRDGSPAAADAKTVRYVQNIVSSGKHLLELINDLLDLAKIEAGRMEVRSQPLSLVDLFEGLVGILKPLAQKKDVTVVPFVGRDVPIVSTDGAKLQQVLYNFLSNAIKFSPAEGRIDLRAERIAEDAVRVSVTDRGPGIPLDKQAIIFEKFRQLDGSVTREHGGTGLGLSISKELTQLLGGAIGVESVPGEGATFWVTLPVKIEARTQQVQLVYANQ